MKVQIYQLPIIFGDSSKIDVVYDSLHARNNYL